MFVALRRQRFGDAMLEVGDEVPHEPGRNYNLMVRQGLVADLEQRAATEEAAAEQAAAYKARISHLEGLLADANEELRGVREKGGKEGEPSDESAKIAELSSSLESAEGAIEVLQAQLAAAQESRAAEAPAEAEESQDSEGEEEAGVDEPDDLMASTLAVLKERAATAGVENVGSLRTKTEAVEAIRAAEAPAEAEE